MATTNLNELKKALYVDFDKARGVAGRACEYSYDSAGACLQAEAQIAMAIIAAESEQREQNAVKIAKLDK